MRLPRILLDYRDLAGAAEDEAAVQALAIDAGRELGFELLAAFHTRALIRRSRFLIRFDTYPLGWDRRLIGRGNRIIDPVLISVRRRASGLLWPDELPKTILDGGRGAIIETARRHGIHKGFTVPVNIPGEPEGSVSFATRSTRRIGRERLLIAAAIAQETFDAMRRLAGLDIVPDPIAAITERERECIYWIAHGKSDRDIAEILGIDLETVRTYVKRAYRKLGNLNNRGQLVHEALRHGLIDFVPTCPPFG